MDTKYEWLILFCYDNTFFCWKESRRTDAALLLLFRNDKNLCVIYTYLGQ